MPLNYPSEWKFEGVGFGVPPAAVAEFLDLMVDIAEGSQSAIESFKTAFGATSYSSSFDWAVSDLHGALNSRSSNAALFVEGLWSGITSVRKQGLKVPSQKVLNSILEKHAVPLRIESSNLVLATGDAILAEAKEDGGAGSTEPVPRFKLIDKIGTGGYGVVYRATRVTAVSEFEYAVKVLDPSPFVTDYEKALLRFQREVKAIQGLQHRGIVSYHEAGLTGDRKPYVVMPLINGSDLRTATTGLDVTRIIDHFLEVVGAIAYAHSVSVLHRDLKPTNVIVRSSDQQPIILDFGSAYLLDDLTSDSLTSNAVGTIGYIPSEVLANPKIRSPLQDVYACGVMLYECIAGHTPDSADYVPLSEIDDRFGILDSIVTKAIAGARKRTQSAKELHDELVAAKAAL